MKKIIVWFSLVVWEVLCISSMVLNFGEYSVGSHLVIAVMAIIPALILYSIAFNKKQKREREDIKIEELQRGLPIINSSPLLLIDEKLHYYEPATLLITKNRVVGHTGGTSGISVRVAKGVYLRSGSSKGRAVHGDVTSTFKGSLAVTDKRIIFVNNQKGFDIKIRNITAMETYSNGIGIQIKTKSYSLILDSPRYFIELFNRVIKQ